VSAPQHVYVYILCHEFPERTKKRVVESLPEHSLSVRWIPVDLTSFCGYSTCPYISQATFARLLIPEVLPASVSRIIYLDADLLVLKDLRTLWNIDLDGYPVGAVLDGLDGRLKAGDPSLADMPSVRDYFNAGVLLIDVRRWRQERISERAIAYLTRNPRSPLSDQDALNVACDGAWKQLESKWNFQNHYTVRIAEMSHNDRPAIVHFVTRLKPWHPSVLSPNASFYDSFRARTMFRRTSAARLAATVERSWWRTRSLLSQVTTLHYIWSHLKRVALRSGLQERLRVSR
jgi:lipopolysaccharide biosynthesis glycosyltransferase